MSLEVFWSSEMPITYPQGAIALGGAFPYRQLRQLYFSTPAGLLIGLFVNFDYDAVLSTPATWPGVAVYYVLCRLWRDGTRLTWDGDGPLAPRDQLGNYPPFVVATDTGTLAWAPEARTYGLTTPGDTLMACSAMSASSYYRLNDLWPMDVHTGEPLASLALLSNSYVGILRPALGTAYRVHRSTSGLTHTEIRQEPGGLVRFSSIYATTWADPRDLLFIDGRTVAVTFKQGANLGLPSLLRVFDTRTSAWTLAWEDTLPGSAHVAAWDPVRQILYATSRYPSNAILYACRLKRAPVTVAVPTLVGAAALQELTPTLISTAVRDARGSVISGQLVRWSLSASLSGGALNSAYSLTNTSGVATITYVGPRLPPAGLTEAVTAAVSDVEG